MALGLLTLYIHLPGCSSLKEKRSRLAPLLARLRKEFNISIAETDQLDSWKNAVIACAWISNESAFTQQALLKIPHWITAYWPDVEVVNDHIDLF
jgi:uncharacterized protein YlxP (DUF503 family)